MKCWEFFSCKEKECPAYESEDLRCWLFSGTYCHGKIQVKFLEKMEICVDCEVFKANMDILSMDETIYLVNKQLNEFRQIVNDKEDSLQRALDESQQRQAEITALLEGYRAILKYHDFKSAATCLFDSCKNLIGATSGYIDLLSKDGSQNEVLFLDSGGLPCTVDPKLRMSIRGLRAEAYRKIKAVYHNDFSKSKFMKFMPKGHVILKNVLFAPMVLDERVVGLLGIANKPGEFTEKDLDLASVFSELAAIALVNKRSEEELQRAHNELEIRVKERTTKLENTINKLAEAQKIAHLGNWEWNIVTNELHWSDEVYRIFGLTPREFGATYDAFLKSVHPEDRDAVKEAVNKSLSDPDMKYNIEHRVVRPDGSERVVHERGKVTFNNYSNPISMIGTVHDITELKKSEDALKKALSEISLLKDRLEAENIYLREEIKIEHHYRDIIGNSDSLKYVLFRVEQVANTDATVLILGETGTGKSLIARAIHNTSPRSEKPFVNVNCAALPANLIESELFGREKGAFTGAQARQIGRFELANGGTIFLDEIGEMPLELQTKLLRVLQDGEFERLGSPNTIKVNVREIASTNRDLKEEVKKGRFRQDLYYRLNVFPITMVPLRQRKEDIPLLVDYFVKKYTNRMGKTIKTVSKATMLMLQAYSWPGNVRELENIIERAVIITHGSTLQISDKLEPLQPVEPAGTADKGLCDIEREHIIKVLKHTRWRIEGKNGAAAILGLNPSTLRGRLRKLGIKRT